MGLPVQVLFRLPGKVPFSPVILYALPGILALLWGPGMVLSRSHQLPLPHHVFYSYAQPYLSAPSCPLGIQAANTNPLLQRTVVSGMSCAVRLPVSGCLSMCLQYQCLEWQ